MLQFLSNNWGIFVVQVVFVFMVSLTFAPLLAKKKQVLFIILGAVTILLCAFFAFQFSGGLPTPKMPPNLPQDLSHRPPPGLRENLTPFGRIFVTPVLINFLLLCLTVVLSIIIEIFLFAKKKEEALILSQNETLANELKLLKSQINPHFLFNALNNIYALSAIDTGKTQQSISYLSNMLRYVLYECEKPFVSLEKEVAYIEDYIKLFTLKSSKKYVIETHFNISNPHIEIAPMLLIPFVENAFKHSNIERVEGTFIKINISDTERGIDFKIENTFGEESIVKDEVGGIGLENVKKRLLILYPEKHKLKISEENHVFTVALNIETHA
jgi:LytS/YehU family sensor histidine kinase